MPTQPAGRPVTPITAASRWPRAQSSVASPASASARAQAGQRACPRRWIRAPRGRPRPGRRGVGRSCCPAAAARGRGCRARLESARHSRPRRGKSQSACTGRTGSSRGRVQVHRQRFLLRVEWRAVVEAHRKWSAARASSPRVSSNCARNRPVPPGELVIPTDRKIDPHPKTEMHTQKRLFDKSLRQSCG